MKAGCFTCRFLSLGAAALMAVAAQASAARADQDRTISFYHIHTKETLTVLYKKNGRFVPDALKQINWIMRDWRKNESTTMDPNTVDIIWDMHRELGSQVPISIISGYRSPATNAMLRKTRGGQATKSQHMTGKAIDIAFPDVPIRRMRYSAMVRERGGVGYYPTSGIPFVHVDTGRVRHWPRMVHDELALLFPSGRSKHQSASGRSISPADVRAARERRKDLVQEVAQFYALRDGPKAPIQVADASARIAAPTPVRAPEPTRAVRPPAPHQRMAVGAPTPSPAETAPARLPSVVAVATDKTPPAQPRGAATLAHAVATDTATQAPPAPKLVATPKPVDRPSQFVARLPDADRSRLDMLVKLASLEPDPPAARPQPIPASLVTGSTPPKPEPVTKPAPLMASASLLPAWPSAKPASLTQTAPDPGVADTAADSASEPNPLADGASDWRSGWITAPEYDDDHPDELSYRPFALAPLLTETPSFDDPALATLVHPDADLALDLLDEEGAVLPMRFGAGHLQTAMAWAQEFKGDAVYLEAMAPPAAAPAPLSDNRLVARAVKTQPR